MRGAGRARGGAAGLVVAVLVVLVLGVAAAFLVARLLRREVVVTTARPSAGATSSASPRATTSAGPASAGVGEPIGFEGCPSDGDGGDRALNRLKNRGPGGTPRDVPFDSLLALGWPDGVAERSRSRWPVGAAARVAPLERLLVRTEGYVARARLSGPESTNCHAEDARRRDYHVWIVGAPGTDRRQSVIAEMTPRYRAEHPSWTVARLGTLSRAGELVRVTGWLLLDQEHPEQIGRTRGTIWEIHPVTAFEVRRGSRWVPLDSARDARRERR